MTNLISNAKVGIDKTGPQVRKGKAMLQRHTQSIRSTYHPYDLRGTNMPSAMEAGWFIKACLKKVGSSGYLGPGGSLRTLE